MDIEKKEKEERKRQREAQKRTGTSLNDTLIIRPNKQGKRKRIKRNGSKTGSRNGSSQNRGKSSYNTYRYSVKNYNRSRRESRRQSKIDQKAMRTKLMVLSSMDGELYDQTLDIESPITPISLTADQMVPLLFLSAQPFLNYQSPEILPNDGLENEESSTKLKLARENYRRMIESESPDFANKHLDNTEPLQATEKRSVRFV